MRADRVGAAEAAAAETATETLIGYFAPHRDPVDYPARLARGSEIGGGVVESAAKQSASLRLKRLKRTGARWRPENAVAAAAPCYGASVDEARTAH
ncbi:MAG: hypothetical protein ACRC1K_25660 [Planctomycetia bacterium]